MQGSLILGRFGGSLSSLLVLDDFRDFVSDVLGAFVGANSVTGETHGLLLLDGVTSLEHLHHLALEGRQSGDFDHDLTDGGDTSVAATFSVRLLLLESIGVLLGLGHNVSLVKTDKNSTFLHHLISFKIIIYDRMSAIKNIKIRPYFFLSQISTSPLSNQ